MAQRLAKTKNRLVPAQDCLGHRCELTQWRILVPTLISAAGLKRDIMIIGSGDHMKSGAWPDGIRSPLAQQIPQLEKYIYKP